MKKTYINKYTNQIQKIKYIFKNLSKNVFKIIKKKLIKINKLKKNKKLFKQNSFMFYKNLFNKKINK